ncbi:MAG: hypothetical protein AAGE52_23650 [Myxococcota bacterium]
MRWLCLLVSFVSVACGGGPEVFCVPETCNGADEDCDGTVDEGDVCACTDEFQGDCNGELVDGCEAHLNSNAANCGSCGNACSASELCVEGRCLEGAATSVATPGEDRLYIVLRDDDLVAIDGRSAGAIRRYSHELALSGMSVATTGDPNARFADGCVVGGSAWIPVAAGDNFSVEGMIVSAGASRIAFDEGGAASLTRIGEEGVSERNLSGFSCSSGRGVIRYDRGDGSPEGVVTVVGAEGPVFSTVPDGRVVARPLQDSTATWVLLEDDDGTNRRLVGLGADGSVQSETPFPAVEVSEWLRTSERSFVVATPNGELFSFNDDGVEQWQRTLGVTTSTMHLATAGRSIFVVGVLPEEGGRVAERAFRNEGTREDLVLSEFSTTGEPRGVWRVGGPSAEAPIDIEVDPVSVFISATYAAGDFDSVEPPLAGEGAIDALLLRLDRASLPR